MNKPTVWILTSEYNLYDQMGEYLEKVYANKPTPQQLWDAGVPQKHTRHVLNGGGRKEWEDHWFNLKEVTPE